MVTGIVVWQYLLPHSERVLLVGKAGSFKEERKKKKGRHKFTRAQQQQKEL